MQPSTGSSPHSVKRWQLHGTDYDPPRSHRRRTDTVFSSWTPLGNSATNLQLFEKRLGLVLHWFDLWTDKQRKSLLHSLLSRCTGSQLKYCRDLLMETVPVTRADFTAVLPRFLSLYVLSFLSPRDLSSAAQVCWTWRVLAEQDCLWASRCVRRGWFLPYTPAEKEYGAWKKHYVSCVATLDWLTPREAAELYGTLNQRRSGAEEEEEERRKERRIRQIIRDRLQQEKREVMRTRKPWGSSVTSINSSRFIQSRMSRTTQSFGSSLPWPSTSTLGLSLDDGRSSTTPSQQKRDTSSLVSPNNSAENPAFLESLGGVLDSALIGDLRCPTGETSTSMSLSLCTLSGAAAPNPHHVPGCVLLISDRVPAYEMVLSGVKAGVTAILYDHRQTLSALLSQVERALSGHRALRLGVLAPGGTEEVHLLQRGALSESSLLAPDHREFWEKLCLSVVRSEAGGGIDIFCPLAASASGVALMQSLSVLTGLEVRAPMGLATGSFQNVLGEWSDGGLSTRLSKAVPDRASSPPLQYLHDSPLQSWAQQAQWMEASLSELRSSMATALQRVSAQIRGRALGHYFQDKVCPKAVNLSRALNEALTKGLTAAMAQEETDQLEFLSTFLNKHVSVKFSEDSPSEEGPRSEEDDSHGSIPAVVELPLALLDWRGALVRELHHSESLYLSRLAAVQQAYQEPLTAALNSNRAILSVADIHIVLSPVSHILDLNRALQVDLRSRLQQWSAQQCVGDVLVKFCRKLRVYTNYFNNYCTALHTIDKRRENRPSFRAFLKRTDRTLATHMLSLQELLLCPLWRIQEYVTLLRALSVHTAPGHADHSHLPSALSSLQQYERFIHKLKLSSQRDRLLEETQQMIHGCPNLVEGNRQLLTTHNCALYTSPDEHAPDSVRALEHVADVGLFLFSDALVLTRRSLRHVPFSLSHSSSHTFAASVALGRLVVREIAHSCYVSHAFVLEGPRRSWVCSSDNELDRESFLSALRIAIETALTGHQA